LANVAIAAVFSGGAGDDVLRGGMEDDLLLGGSGHDRLVGRKGDDLLLGGTGHDRLKGRRGDDVLVGRDFVSLRTLPELRALQAAWSAGIDLPPDAELAVFDDAFDLLKGGRGRDLFFASLADCHDRKAKQGDLLRVVA
jgi:Ca2+-binding RTX toxin-like protein